MEKSNTPSLLFKLLPCLGKHFHQSSGHTQKHSLPQEARACALVPAESEEVGSGSSPAGSSNRKPRAWEITLLPVENRIKEICDKHSETPSLGKEICPIRQACHALSEYFNCRDTKSELSFALETTLFEAIESVDESLRKAFYKIYLSNYKGQDLKDMFKYVNDLGIRGMYLQTQVEFLDEESLTHYTQQIKWHMNLPVLIRNQVSEKISFISTAPDPQISRALVWNNTKREFFLDFTNINQTWQVAGGISFCILLLKHSEFHEGFPGEISGVLSGPIHFRSSCKLVLIFVANFQLKPQDIKCQNRE